MGQTKVPFGTFIQNIELLENFMKVTDETLSLLGPGLQSFLKLTFPLTVREVM